MNSFHDRIMNIQSPKKWESEFRRVEMKEGHKVARHSAAEIANEADDIISRQSASIKALTEALNDLLEFTESEHVKPYNGHESVCHHPNCGESGGHLPWCPIGAARSALAQAREEE